MFLAVTTFAFVTFQVIPDNPAARSLGPGASAAAVARRAHQLGTDRPLHVQYAHFLWRMVGHQSLGRSYSNRQSVNEIVGNAAPVTASLVAGGAVLWMLLA